MDDMSERQGCMTTTRAGGEAQDMAAGKDRKGLGFTAPPPPCGVDDQRSTERG